MSMPKVSHWDPSPSFFQTLRIGILVLICSLHIALIIVSALALSLGSGGGSQIAVIVFASSTLFAVASFSLIQKLNPIPDKALGQTRRLIFVPCIIGFSICVFCILIARIPGSRIAADYAPLGDLSTLVLALGLFAALFACLLPFVYPFYYNGSTTRIGDRCQRTPTERSLDVFEVETLPPFPSPSPSPLPLVYIDPSGRWSYTQPPAKPESQLPQAEGLAPAAIPSKLKQISSDPFFDVNLYDVGMLPDGTSTGEPAQWPRIGRFSRV